MLFRSQQERVDLLEPRDGERAADDEPAAFDSALGAHDGGDGTEGVGALPEALGFRDEIGEAPLERPVGVPDRPRHRGTPGRLREGLDPEVQEPLLFDLPETDLGEAAQVLGAGELPGVGPHRLDAGVEGRGQAGEALPGEGAGDVGLLGEALRLQPLSRADGPNSASALSGPVLERGAQESVELRLAAGRLVAPFKVTAQASDAYWLVCLPATEARSSFQAFRVFRAWLLKAVSG